MSNIKNHRDLIFDLNHLQKGAALEINQNEKNWDRCIVTDVHPNNYSVDVYTDRGSFISNLPWPINSAGPTTPSGEIYVPKRGQRFAIHYEFGIPHLIQDIQEPQLNPPTNQETRILNTVSEFGGDDGLYTDRGGPQYRGRKPVDVMPGDWVRLGSDGNMIGVLEGGINIFKASELCQIIASKSGDLMRILGRNVDIFTSFGEVSFRNEQGNTSMTLKGGSHLSTETNPQQDNFTIYMELGDAGDLVNFKITDPRGKILSQINYKPDGSINKVANNITSEVTGTVNERIHKDIKTEINGSETRTIDGSFTETVSGGITQEVFGSKSSQATIDQTISAQRDINLSAGRALNQTVTGDILAVPGDASVKTTITNGSWVIDIGNPVAGDLQKALSGYSMQTYLGDISFSSIAGHVNLKTLIPDSVLLGGQLPLFHAMKFELFQVFMEVFGNLLDTHIHATGVGPSSPPIIPPFATSQSGILPIKSIYATYGG